MAANDPAFLVSKAEERYSDRLDEIAERIFSDREKRIVMLAGPSASGKTTTAGLIASRLESRGAKAFTVSLDDFYHDQRDAILDENGKPDYETVNALDIVLIDSCLEDIIKNGTTRLPHFDFVSGRRSGFSDPITLGKDDVLIVEGIHALNDIIIGKNPKAFKLYIAARSNVVDDGKVIFDHAWLRLCRRIVRDHKFRGSNAEFTMKMWDNVRRGEKLYISPYKENADLMFDSSLACEFSVLKPYVVPLLEELPRGKYPVADQILEAYEKIEGMDDTYLAPDSLAREFVGGSTYTY